MANIPHQVSIKFYPLKILQTVLARWHDDTWRDSDPPRLLERVAMKLCEEVGEVHGALIKSTQDHPKKDEQDLPGELADVIICTLILAEYAHVDLSEAVLYKIARLPKFEEGHYLER